MIEQNELLLDVNQISSLMKISVPTAYKLIQKLNSELKQNGYIVIAGKINRRYFESKVFGGLV